MAVGAAALVPVGAVYLEQMWAVPHFRFVPLLLLLIAAVAWKRYRWEPTVPEGAWPRAWRWSAVAVAGLMMIAGGLIPSPWLFWLGALLWLAPFAAALRHRDDRSAAWGPWLLLWLSVRPPGPWGDRLIQGLQNSSTVAASHVLELLGVFHHRSGNVIEVPGKRFLVEEACSGVQSLFTLLFFAGAIAVYYRRSLVQAVLLLSTAALWAWLMNVMRILAVVVGHEKFTVDLATGWQHDLVGYTALTVAFLLLLSTDRLLFFFTGPIRAREIEDYPLRRISPLVLGYNRWIGGSPEPWAVWSRFTQPHARRSRRLSPGLLMSLGGVAVLGGGVGWPSSYAYATGKKSGRPPAPAALPLADETLPQSVGPWRRRGFATEQRGRNSAFGAHSGQWSFGGGHGSALVSCDYFFRGYHDLTVCYRNIGWELTERRAVRGGKHGDWQAVEARFRKPSGEHAYLVFSLFEASGRTIGPERDSLIELAANRLASLGRFARDKPPAVQAQVLLVTPAPAGDEQTAAARRLHFATREQLLETVLPMQHEPGR